MNAPSSCQHRGSMIAQKRACMAGSKTANSGRINPHREIISRRNRETQETAKSTQQPAARTTSRTNTTQTTSRITHGNRTTQAASPTATAPQILPNSAAISTVGCRHFDGRRPPFRRTLHF
uniref:Uncharacterized protein n=1 Tax=Ditylum brightwellii TaxID=49249 RepID=A0A7S4SBG9_9STRA